MYLELGIRSANVIFPLAVLFAQKASSIWIYLRDELTVQLHPINYIITKNDNFYNVNVYLMGLIGVFFVIIPVLI